MVFIDSTVVNVALPALAHDLGASLAAQQWAVEAYLLTLGSLVLVGGSLGDLLGRRRVFVWGVVGFGLTSVLCALAPSAGALIGFRALQGVAGALLVPSSLAIITASFPARAARGAAIGSWTAWTSAAIAVGPLARRRARRHASRGGSSSRSTCPVAIAALWMTRARRAGACRPARTRTVDVVGGVLCALGLAGPVFALIEQPSRGWDDPLILGALIGGLVLLALFFVWEARWARAPMLPLHLFRARNFAVGNGATFAVYAGLGAATFFVALFVQEVAGYSALAGRPRAAAADADGARVRAPLRRALRAARPAALHGPRPARLLGRPAAVAVARRARDVRDAGAAGRDRVRPGPGDDGGAADGDGAGRRRVRARRASRAASTTRSRGSPSLLAIAIVGAVVTTVLLDRGGAGATRLGDGRRRGVGGGVPRGAAVRRGARRARRRWCRWWGSGTRPRPSAPTRRSPPDRDPLVTFVTVPSANTGMVPLARLRAWARRCSIRGEERMDRPIIYASSVTRRQARWRRARRRGGLLGPRLAMLALSASACAFAITVLERLT